jgi:hypothetical protein
MLQNAENVMNKFDIGYMYNLQWLKNKVKHKQRVHYICVDLHGEKALQLLIKYTRVFVLTLYIVNKNYQ